MPTTITEQPADVVVLGVGFMSGVGGAAQHEDGAMGRKGPWGYQMRSQTDTRYPGMLNTINPHNDLEDWPLTYAQYEPYYVQWERAHGLCGNYNGSKTNSPSDTG